METIKFDAFNPSEFDGYKIKKFNSDYDILAMSVIVIGVTAIVGYVVYKYIENEMEKDKMKFYSNYPSFK